MKANQSPARTLPEPTRTPIPARSMTPPSRSDCYANGEYSPGTGGPCSNHAKNWRTICRQRQSPRTDGFSDPEEVAGNKFLHPATMQSDLIRASHALANRYSSAEKSRCRADKNRGAGPLEIERTPAPDFGDELLRGRSGAEDALQVRLHRLQLAAPVGPVVGAVVREVEHTVLAAAAR